MWVASGRCLSNADMLQQRSLLGLFSVLSVSHDDRVDWPSSSWCPDEDNEEQQQQYNGDDTELHEGLLRPAVQGMTYPVSELDPISAAIGNLVRAHVSCSCQVINIQPARVP